MAQQMINTNGVDPSGTGSDPAKTAFNKCNANFSELYTDMNAPRPIARGGTGATTAAAARAALGLRGAAQLDVGTVAGTVAAGNDGRLGTVDGKTGGAVAGSVISQKARTSSTTGQSNQGGSMVSGFSGAAGGFSFYLEEIVNTSVQGVLYATNGATGSWWVFNIGGNATALGGSWVNGSDIRIKDNIQKVDGALSAVLSWSGCSWSYKDGGYGVGLLAQDVERNCPGAVEVAPGSRTFTDGTVVEGIKSLNTSGVSAAYHTEAIKQIFSLLELALNDPEAARAQIEALKRAALAG